jgi:hypothetical protein
MESLVKLRQPSAVRRERNWVLPSAAARSRSRRCCSA